MKTSHGRTNVAQWVAAVAARKRAAGEVATHLPLMGAARVTCPSDGVIESNLPELRSVTWLLMEPSRVTR